MMRSQEPGLWSQLPHLMASPRVASLLSRSPWGPMEGDVGGGASYPVQEEVRVERAQFSGIEGRREVLKPLAPESERKALVHMPM